jgi:hypothetical protein
VGRASGVLSLARSQLSGDGLHCLCFGAGNKVELQTLVEWTIVGDIAQPRFYI